MFDKDKLFTEEELDSMSFHKKNGISVWFIKDYKWTETKFRKNKWSCKEFRFKSFINTG